MKTLDNFLSESFEPSGNMKLDTLATRMAKEVYGDSPHMQDVHVYHTDVGHHKMQVVHFKNKEGQRELHFTNFTGGMPSVGTPEPGPHVRQSIRFFADMFHAVKPHFDAGEPVKIQSFDAPSHARHMQLIGAILNHKMPGQFEIKHVGETKSEGFGTGRFPSSIITKK